jgi:hypothetical protein
VVGAWTATGAEILFGAEDGRLYGFGHDGTPVAGFPIQTAGEVRGSAALGDVDGDGLIEVVAAGWDKSLYVWDLAGAASPERLPWAFFRRDAANRGNVALAGPPAGRGPGPAPPPGAAFDVVPQLLAPWPNPANRGGDQLRLPRGGRVRLALYGVDGRVVCRLETASAPPTPRARLGRRHRSAAFQPVRRLLAPARCARWRRPAPRGPMNRGRRGGGAVSRRSRRRPAPPPHTRPEITPHATWLEQAPPSLPPGSSSMLRDRLGRSDRGALAESEPGASRRFPSLRSFS